MDSPVAYLVPLGQVDKVSHNKVVQEIKLEIQTFLSSLFIKEITTPKMVTLDSCWLWHEDKLTVVRNAVLPVPSFKTTNFWNL